MIDYDPSYEIDREDERPYLSKAFQRGYSDGYNDDTPRNWYIWTNQRRDYELGYKKGVKARQIFDDLVL